MKRPILFALSVVSIFGLMGADSCQPTQSVDLTVFHTNDLHYRLRASKSDPFQLGGMARLSTLLQERRKSAPNSITLDGGDWSEGATWYYNLDLGVGMLKLMSKMGFDATVLGNHDFLSGPGKLIQTLRQAGTQLPVLAANIDTSSYSDSATLKSVLPPYVIKNVNGIKVGLIGLTTYDYIYDVYFDPVRITNPIDSATAVAKELRPKVDLLFIVSHNSFKDNLEVARAVPGVDAVISGHSHVKKPKGVYVQNGGKSVPVLEVGQWGTFLGELKLRYFPESKIIRVMGYQIHPVTRDIPEDPAILALVDEAERILKNRIGDDPHRVVAHADFELDRDDDNVEGPLGNLAARAYRWAANADIGFETNSFLGVSLAEGPVTLMDLHDVVPHIYNPTSGKEWELKVWNAKGRDLRLALDVFFGLSAQNNVAASLFGWLSTDQLEVFWEPKSVSEGNGFTAVQAALFKGQLIEPEKRYRIALHDGLWLGIFLANERFGLGLDLSDVTATGFEAWSAVVNYAAHLQRLDQSTFSVGGRVLTQGPDAAIHKFGLRWDGNNLQVEVQNHGLTATGPGNVICHSGLPDQPGVYATDEQSWTELGKVQHPGIGAKASASVSIPWRKAGNHTRFPVKCEADFSSDSFSKNNQAMTVLTGM